MRQSSRAIKKIARKADKAAMCPSSTGRSVLVVAAHPDDEVLGCGASMARHAAQGDRVAILILGQGVYSRGAGTQPQSDLDHLRECARRAADIVGATSLELHDLPDNRMDEIALLDIAKLVEAAVAKHGPQIVYTHFPGDLNVDHGRVSEAVAVACRPYPGNQIESLRYFEVQSSTEWRPPHGGSAPFGPNLFVDVSTTLEKKLAALRAYEKEMRPFPHARSIEAVEHLARWRGASVGLHAAEAFVIARAVE